ncbi:MAG: ABC transporter permease subunit [Thalassotalea sp.]
MTITSKSADPRQLKNKLAQYLITLGGISVLFTLVLIFLYLLYVIKPIFESAHIEQIQSIPTPAADNLLDSGLDELKEVAYQLDSSGSLSFYQLSKSDFREAGSLLLTQTLTDSPIIVAAAGNNGKKVIADSQGYVKVYTPVFVASYSDQGRDITPKVNFPLGEEAIVVDEQEAVLNNIDFAMDDEKAVFVAFTKDKRLIKTTLMAEDDFSYDPAYEIAYQTIDIAFDKVDDLLVAPDLSMVFVRANNIIKVFDISDEYSVDLKATIIPSVKGQNFTSMALLSGGSSLLIGDSNGKVNQWFEVATDQGRQFKEIRQFEVSEFEAISQIFTEQFRKSFYTMTTSGEMGVFYTTSEADLWRGKITTGLPTTFAIAPRADGLLIAENNQLKLFSVENEHPEVTWQALWQEVWYEGYPEPDYIWQSTSGSDDFEAKFSLVPISFGTIKAALYAMLFAVPIALSAAIYTAYFMPTSLRKKVKPTIELMEALPTVILGFLAGLWLAPLIEDYLPGVFLLLLFLPLTTFAVAFAWYNLPKKYKSMIPESWAPIILIPFLLIAGYGAFAISPVLEGLLFGGDIRQYITNELGVNFDQRNALVVGIAMGFAVIPTIFSMAEDAIFSVPKHLTSGSLALGATPWQTLVKVVLLTASPGIFSAVMMGLGRAVGETMIVLMATGNTPIVDWSIFQGMRTLAANIAVEMPESEVGSSHYRILFLAAFVLFVFTFIFNTVAEFVRQRLREKYSSL